LSSMITSLFYEVILNHDAVMLMHERARRNVCVRWSSYRHNSRRWPSAQFVSYVRDSSFSNSFHKSFGGNSPKSVGASN